MQQFKQHLLFTLKVETYGQIVDLCPGVPKSEIVYKETNVDLSPLKRFKETAYELHKKYVEEGSEFEINISSRMRRELQHKMGDYDVWMESTIPADELSWIFDDVMEENIKLLKQSKERFHCKLERMSTSRRPSSK